MKKSFVLGFALVSSLIWALGVIPWAAPTSREGWGGGGGGG